MQLFKLKPEIAADSTILFKIAQEIFGTALEISFQDHKSSISWKSGFLVVTLSHVCGDSVFGLSLDRSSFNDVVFAQDIHDAMSSWLELWDIFSEAAGKPWSDWSEDEIMESTMWCRYFVESGNIPSGRIHTMMVLKSYENTDDPHIKGYFKCVDQQPS